MFQLYMIKIMTYELRKSALLNKILTQLIEIEKAISLSNLLWITPILKEAVTTKKSNWLAIDKYRNIIPKIIVDIFQQEETIKKIWQVIITNGVYILVHISLNLFVM